MSNITAEQDGMFPTKEVPNTHKVPKKLWNGFGSDKARRAYNDIYSKTLKNQAIIVHPKAVWIDEEHWKTLCHNFACLAAWAVGEQPFLEKHAVVKDVDKTERVVRKHFVK